MLSSPSTPQLVTRECRDFEEFAGSARGWDLDFVQLDHGPFRADLFQLASREAHLAHARYNRVLDQRGSTPPGLRTFVVLSEASSPYTSRHGELPANGVIVYSPHAEIDGVARPGFDGYALSFSEELLAAVGETSDLGDLDGLLPGSEVVRCAPPAMLELRRGMRDLRRLAVKSHRPSVARELLHELQFELPRRLLEALASSRSVRSFSQKSGKRDRTLRHLREYIDAFSDERLTVRDLCRVADVSERTLQYAFLEHFGVSPKAYLREFRLNRARRELHETDPSTTTIIAVANRWGFWHMGQFAADYRRLFGERPSETLARSGRVLSGAR